jgi:hypothetical protein
MKSLHASPSKDCRQIYVLHWPFLPLHSSLKIEYSKYVIPPRGRPYQTALAQLGREDSPPHISMLDPVLKLVVNLVVLKRLLLLLVELLLIHRLHLYRLLLLLLERPLIHTLLLRFLNFLKRQS